MSNIVIFGSTQSGKTTLLGYLSTAMLRHPQLNAEIYRNLKLIKRLTINDEFNIGDPHNPINVNKGVIFPSFVSLDKNELDRFRGQNTEGTTKRLHRKQLTICITENHSVNENQDENENIVCTFVDIPGYRQRLSDKYRGFFEGDVGIAVLKITELVELYNLIVSRSSDEDNLKIDTLIGRLFEPIRVWCDYRSPNSIIIAISQIDLVYNEKEKENVAKGIQEQQIKFAIECVNLIVERFNRGIKIPICPISINLESEENQKKYPPMKVFFHRVEENIYFEPKNKKIPGSGTLISCLRKILTRTETKKESVFSMASVNKVMKTIVGASPKTALNVHAIHGTIHKSDKVILGPIIHRSTKEIVYVECDISSIKADGAQSTSEMLLRGNVGGIIFNNIKNINTGHEYQLSYDSEKSDLAILKSTILYKGETIKGDILEIEIDESEYINTNGSIDEIYSRVIPSLMPFDEIILFWYGKKISVNVVEIILQKNKVKISVIISKNEKNSTKLFVLPSDDSIKVKHKDNVLLAIPRSYYSTMPIEEVQGKFTYVSCCITLIKDSGDFDEIRIESNGNVSLNELFDDLALNHIEKINYIEKIDDKVSINISDDDGKKKLDILSLYKIIGRSIKDCHNHRSYRQLGGVEICLLEDKRDNG